MKTKLLLLVLSGLLLAFTSGDRKSVPATVELVDGVPFYVYSLPTAEYEIVGKALTMGGIIKVMVNEQASIREKASEFVKNAKARVEKGKIPEFDAMIVDLEKEKTHAIKYKAEASREAKVKFYEGIPVYFFSKPNAEYEVVTELEADYSLRAKGGMLLDKIESMLNRTLKKEKDGEVGHFDAVIINPDDLSEQLIKFK